MKNNSRIALGGVTPTDIVMVAAILLLTVGTILQGRLNFSQFSAAAAEASVSVDGRFDRHIDLSRDHEITLLDGKMVLEIKGNRLRVKKSECPHQVCVQSGWIDDDRKAIVCIPFKTIIEIRTPGITAMDAVVY